MLEVRYDGPGSRLLAFGQEVLAGHMARFTQAEVDSLQTQPRIHITVLGEIVDRPAASASKTAWATYAATLDIDPSGLTRDEIIAAVDAAQNDAQPPSSGGEPEADNGEGHHDDTDKE
jgi:hypothetical protein